MVGQKIPMAGLVKLGKPLKSVLLVEEFGMGIVHDDLTVFRIDRAQDHLASTLFDLVPEEVELQNMFDEVVYRNGRRYRPTERRRQLRESLLSTRFDVLV